MTPISSVYVPPSAPMAAQVAARPAQQAGGSFNVAAGQTSSLAATATATSQDKTSPIANTQDKPDLLANLQTIEAQIAARVKQATDVNTLDISYDKKQAALSVKVMQEQTGQQVRELIYKDYQAMGYSTHGYKGSVVDAIA